MDEITPIGWVIIGGFIVFVIAMNLTLVFALRKMKNPIDTKVQKNLQNLTRNPWQKEDDQWRELADKVAKLKAQEPPEDHQPDDSSER